MSNIVDTYNQAERAGRATVSNRAIESFSLEVFNTLGYPYRIDDESELWRYHDVMNEGGFRATLSLIGSYSDKEFELITKTAKQILSFSERHLPIRNSGKHALTRSLYQYQLLMKYRPHNGPLRILEIGPGSGYLGLLLANDGHQYFAMDAAQAFYLYQKNFGQTFTAQITLTTQNHHLDQTRSKLHTFLGGSSQIFQYQFLMLML